MLDFDTPKFTLSEAAKAAGYVSVSTLRSYYQRRHFFLVGGMPPTGDGLPNQVRFRDIVHLAVAQRLIGLGVRPNAAFVATLPLAQQQVDLERIVGAPDLGALFIWQPDTGGKIVTPAEQMCVALADVFYGGPRTGPSRPSVIIAFAPIIRAVLRSLKIKMPGGDGG